MPTPPPRHYPAADHAAALAGDLAEDLTAVVFTHFADVETLDTFRPGETDVAQAVAVNRAAAAELASRGVRVSVQKADRAAFRRWTGDRPDTPENRWAWRDRAQMLHGAAALELLGVDPALLGRPKFGDAPGPAADRLVKAFFDESDEDFDALANELLASGRGGILDLAARKAADLMEEAGDDDFVDAVLLVAEGAEIGPSGWAALIALPAALPPGDLPEAAALAESLLAAGVIEPDLEVRFLPGWRSPDALSRLDPSAIRRVLTDLAAGGEPYDLPPADADDLARDGFGVLIGVQFDWSAPAWEEVNANGAPDDDFGDEESPEDAERAKAFDRWRSEAYVATGGCVALALAPPSLVQEEIEGFMAEAGEQVDAITQIRDLVAAARVEAGTEDIVCRPEVVGDDLEISLYARDGRFLSGLTLPADELPTRAEEMPRLIGAFVTLARDTPGG